jgi:hypothetical protein
MKTEAADLQCRMRPMPRIQPTLHDAMRAILKSQPAGIATLQLLAEKNRELDLYRQDHGDGRYPEEVQFKLRAMQYPRMFDFVPPDKVQLL